MGALQSIIPIIPLVREGLGLVTNTSSNESAIRNQQIQQQQALQNLQAKQKQDAQDRAKDNALDDERAAATNEKAEQDRRQALRRAVATQRAKFGVRGTGSSGGSAEAVLLGLLQDVDEETAQSERLENIRQRTQELSGNRQRSLNVLARTQLQEKQKLSRLSTIDKTSNRVGSGLDALETIDSIADVF